MLVFGYRIIISSSDNSLKYSWELAIFPIFNKFSNSKILNEASNILTFQYILYIICNIYIKNTKKFITF